LLAFVIFWAYIAYAQGFIYWIGNKPEEVVWYVPRVAGSWGWLALVLVFAHFVVPFALLLPRAAKYSADYLVLPAILVIIAQYIDATWLVLPAAQPNGWSPSFVDAAALAAVAGLALAAAGFASRGASLIPERAPDLAIGAHYEPQP